MTEPDEAPIWNGPCVGGPLDGLDGSSRYERGFLLVDRPAGKAWIYDCHPETLNGGYQFIVRVAEGMDLIEDEDAVKNRYRAADEQEFDVIAAPWIGEDKS